MDLMDKYLTEEAKVVFDEMRSNKRRKRVLIRMLAFVDGKISECGHSIPRKLLEKRDKCQTQFNQEYFRTMQLSYKMERLKDNNMLLCR